MQKTRESESESSAMRREEERVSSSYHKGRSRKPKSAKDTHQQKQSQGKKLEYETKETAKKEVKKKVKESVSVAGEQSSDEEVREKPALKSLRQKEEQTNTAKTPRVRGVTRTPALTVNTVLSRTGTGLRCDGAITDSAPTICAGFIAGSAQHHCVHGFQRIPARRPLYQRYPDRSSHGSLASTTLSLAGPGVVIQNNYVLLLI